MRLVYRKKTYRLENTGLTLSNILRFHKRWTLVIINKKPDNKYLI